MESVNNQENIINVIKSIDIKINELNVCSVVIKTLDNLYENNKLPESDKQEAFDLLIERINSFNNTSKSLKKQLEWYFELERKEKGPVNLFYRQIYNQIKKDLF